MVCQYAKAAFLFLKECYSFKWNKGAQLFGFFEGMGQDFLKKRQESLKKQTEILKILKKKCICIAISEQDNAPAH